MKNNQPDRIKLVIFSFLVLLSYSSCGDKDLEPVIKTDADDIDVTDDDWSEDVMEEDAVEEDPDEEEVVRHCVGSDTLNLQFKDWRGNLVEGVVVALRCLDDQFETVSDEDGIASFENVDITSQTVDFTYVYSGEPEFFDAVGSFLGVGGSRPIPDPLSLTLIQNDDDYSWMEGPVSHSLLGSWILTNTYPSDGFNMTQGSSYGQLSMVGENLKMAVFECESSGESLEPFGYSLIDYDFLMGAVEGPEANAEPAAFESATIQLQFDISEDSPLHDRSTDIEHFGYGSVFVHALDSAGRFHLAGITTSWEKGDTMDTLEVAWVPDEIEAAEAIDVYARISDPAYQASIHLPDDPELWLSHTFYDLPEIPGFDAEPISFSGEIEINHPEWASMVSFFLAFFLETFDKGWEISVHPETVSFSLSSLPWPSSIDRSDFFHLEEDNCWEYGWITATASDDDPFNNYIYWTDPAWRDEHWTSVSHRIYRDFECPE